MDQLPIILVKADICIYVYKKRPHGEYLHNVCFCQSEAVRSAYQKLIRCVSTYFS